MNFALISAAIAGAIGFGLAWQLQNGTITELRLEHANERIAIQRAARTAAEGYLLRVSKAQESAQVRVVALRRDAVAAGTELDSLRTQSAASLRAATDNVAACLADATAKSELLDQCAARYSRLGAQAQGHVIDIQTLTATWPQ